MKNCPFDDGEASSEISRAFQGGRLDMLFSFVNDGRISLADAALIEGFGLDEAEELMESWRYFKCHAGCGG